MTPSVESWACLGLVLVAFGIGVARIAWWHRRDRPTPQEQLIAELRTAGWLDAPNVDVSSPRAELREWPTPTSTRYIRGEFAVPERDACIARLLPHPGPLYAQDAARALGIEDVVGVHVGFRWANVAQQWQVCRVDRDGEPVGGWVTVPTRPSPQTG